MTPFEVFYEEEFQRLLATTKIPASALSHPPADPDDFRPSWDRIAAWLLWSKDHEPEPEEDDPYDGY